MRALGWMVTVGACGLLGAAFGACSAGGSGTGVAGSGGAVDTGGMGFGAGSQGGLDAGQTDAGDDAEECAAVSETAQPKKQPADIIWAIDTSGSMGEESYLVRTQMNSFSNQIIQSGIDVHVVMIAEPPPPFFPCSGPLMCPPGICIDPPLGSGACPADENPPHYFHIKITDQADSDWIGDSVGQFWSVFSDDGMHVIYHSYNDWGPYLRPEATHAFAVITDDDARLDDATTGKNYHTDPDSFIADITALDPLLDDGSGNPNWTLSAIYCFTDCPDAAMVGSTWQYVVDQTNGIKGDLCQQDFQPVFDDLADAIIVAAAELPCQWDIPDPPEGESLDPDRVNVEFTDGDGNTSDIYKVDDEESCDPTQGGWYYDDNQSPETIILCPASCDEVSSDPSGHIDILFGCATKPMPPPR